MNKKMALGLGGAAVALAVGLGFGIDAMADETTTAPATQVERGWMGGGPRGGMTEADVEARHADLAKYLAGELGVAESDVTAALDSWQQDRQAERQASMTEAMEERLAEAVEAGQLTQEQADAIKAAHESGAMAAPNGMGGHGGMRGFGPRR